MNPAACGSDGLARDQPRGRGARSAVARSRSSPLIERATGPMTACYRAAAPTPGVRDSPPFHEPCARRRAHPPAGRSRVHRGRRADHKRDACVSTPAPFTHRAISPSRSAGHRTGPPAPDHDVAGPCARPEALDIEVDRAIGGVDAECDHALLSARSMAGASHPRDSRRSLSPAREVCLAGEGDRQ